MHPSWGVFQREVKHGASIRRRALRALKSGSRPPPLPPKTPAREDFGAIYLAHIRPVGHVEAQKSSEVRLASARGRASSASPRIELKQDVPLRSRQTLPSGSEMPLYTELGAHRNELRLITFEQPPAGSTLLHCHLGVYSLDDRSQSYQAHLAAEAVEGKPRRKHVTSWKSRNGIDPVSGPTPAACRFAWGDYASLSYVWGSEAQKRAIIVNGREMMVTKNLEIALRALARAWADGEHYKLWVDALCINQADERERAAQVARMRDIYSGAWSVTAWLGGEYDCSSEAYALLERLASLAEESKKAPFGQFGLPSSLFFGYYFYGLNELMRRPYWSRLWIVQEIVMGASSVVVRCGDRLMDWDTFCAGITVLYRPDLWHIKDELLVAEVNRHNLDGEHQELTWSTERLHMVKRELQLLSRYEEQGDGKLGFRRLLDIATSSQCRDTRDKVFALLGMMEPEIGRKLVHDYSISPAELFASAARAFITHFGNLEPLREGNPWGKVGTPTWAADWTWEGRMRYSRAETPLWGYRHLTDAPEALPGDVYSAAGRRPAEFSFPDDRLLRCKGFILDSIGGLGARAHGYWKWSQGTVHQYPAWRSAYGGREATAAALCQTLLLGRMSGGAPTEPRHAAILSLPKSFRRDGLVQFLKRGWVWMAAQKGYYFRWQRWRAANDDLVLGEDQRLGDFFTDKIPDGAEEHDYTDVYGAFRRTSQERRFMLTAKGYMGWAPENTTKDEDSARPGDIICIVFGCSTPLVIRPSEREGEFQVIGEAYVEGFMDGQALQGDAEPDIVDFTFC